jgi:hypothetical protein
VLTLVKTDPVTYVAVNPEHIVSAVATSQSTMAISMSNRETFFVHGALDVFQATDGPANGAPDLTPPPQADDGRASLGSAVFSGIAGRSGKIPPGQLPKEKRK